MDKAIVEIWDMHEPIKENSVSVYWAESKEAERFDNNTEKEIDLIWNAVGGKDNPLVNLVDYISVNDFDIGQAVRMLINKGNFRYHRVLNKQNEIPEQLKGKIKSKISDFKSYAIKNNHLVLTAVALLYTKDNKVVIAEKHKGPTTGEKDKLYSVIPGGYMLPTDVDSDRTLSINRAIRREFVEELKISEDYIAEMGNTGMLFSDYKHNRGFTTTYLIKVNMIFDELNKNFKAKAKKTPKELIGADFTKDGINSLLDKYLPNFTNNGLGCLLVSGKAVLGADWFKTTKNFIEENYFKDGRRAKIDNISHSGNVKDILKDRTYHEFD